MTKRGMALVTAALMIWVAAVPAFSADVPYPDVSPDHWAYEAIASLHAAGLVEGYPDGTFGGERTFTRYEMAMVFDRILQRLDKRMDMLAGLDIDVDALMEEFGPELGLVNALTVAIGNAQKTAAEAKEIAEAASTSAETAGDRAYRARLNAEQALAEAKKANEAAAMAMALAQGGDAADSAEGAAETARAAAQRAQRVAADAEAAALRATAIAETAFASEDAALALETAEAAADRAYRARLAAQQARALAEEALEVAQRGLTIAEAAYSGEVLDSVGESNNALAKVEETRQAAQRAQRVAADAEAAALKAQAMADRALSSNDAVAALEQAEAAAERAYRARLAAEQAAALGEEANDNANKALAMGEMALNEARSVVGIAEEARQLATAAMAEVERQNEIAQSNLQDVVDLAMQADRLAYLAHLSAERALSVAEQAHGRIDDLEGRLATAPRITGELRADYENAHTNAEDKLIDPRDPRGSKSPDKTYNESDITVSVALGTVIEPKDGVRVEGGLKFGRSVFGATAQDFKLSDLYVDVTTEGTLRQAYFGSVTGATLGTNFHKYTFNADAYSNRVARASRGGAFAEFQIGNLNTRLITSKTNTPDELVYGFASRLPLAEGMNVGFSLFQADEDAQARAFSVDGTAATLDYDWQLAQFKGDMAIDGSLSTNVGALSVDYRYRSIGDAFEGARVDPDDSNSPFIDPDYFGQNLTFKDDGIEAGHKDSVLTLGLPLWALTAEYEKGYAAELDDANFRDWHKIGFADANILGFGLDAHYYMDERDPDKETQAYRIGVARTIELGLPLTFRFTQANIGLTNDTGAAGWDEKTHQAFGVALEDLEVSETLTLNAGYKLEKNPLGDDWTKVADWDVVVKDDADNAQHGFVKERTTLSAGASLAATDALTLTGGYSVVTNDMTGGVDVVVNTTDLGAKYGLSLYEADVTLGYAWQKQTKTNLGHVASPRTTYSVDVKRDVWGGQVDAGYKLVTGRGTDKENKVDARDMVANLGFTYPVADGMDFSLNGKWTNSEGDTDSGDYYFSSVMAGFGVKF